MHIGKYLILVFLIILTTLQLIAQEYLFDVQVINIEDGLPDREVYTIVQDKAGFIWISTQGAISRYDGYHFKTYTATDLNINETQPVFMAIDNDNNLWYCYNNESQIEQKTRYLLEELQTSSGNKSFRTFRQTTRELLVARIVLQLIDTWK